MTTFQARFLYVSEGVARDLKLFFPIANPSLSLSLSLFFLAVLLPQLDHNGCHHDDVRVQTPVAISIYLDTRLRTAPVLQRLRARLREKNHRVFNQVIPKILI